MVYFYIAGTPDCLFFAHALHVANYLSENLPDFKVIKKEKKPADWKQWLHKKNTNFGWHHFDSPLIWKTLTMEGAKPYYIGGLSEFWEYCYDYYDLESILPKTELEKLVNDSMQYFHKDQERHEKIKSTATRLEICIHEGDPQMLMVFCTELLSLDELSKKFQYIHLKIYSKKQNDEDIEKLEYACEHFVSKSVIVCEYTTDIKYALDEVDLLIIFGNLAREPGEEFKKWLERSRTDAMKLSTSLNVFGNPSMRVIVAIHGPMCFYASLLESSSFKLDGRNVVAVTADLGYEALNLVAKETNTPLSQLGLPPIWGFAGINHDIDIHHIVEKCQIYRPYNRALKMVPDSTLVSGTNVTEFRFMAYKTYFLEDFWRKLKKNQELKQQTLKRPPYYQKVQATIAVIKNWYSDDTEGIIMSLGILSVGTENSTAGLNWSVPAMVDNGVWQMVKHFPKPAKDLFTKEDFVQFIYEILDNFNYEPKFSSFSKKYFYESSQITFS